MTSVQVSSVPTQRQGNDGPFRDRLIEGLAEAIRKQGLQDTTIADIVSFARTSRRTFYEVFSSKEDCYMALMRRENQRISESIMTAVDPQASWSDQVAQAIEAWISAQAAEPELNLSWIRETPVLGGGPRDLVREFMDVLVVLIQGLCATEEMQAAGVIPPSRETTIILLGGLSALFATAVEAGEDVMDVVRPCIDATMALIGPRPHAA